MEGPHFTFTTDELSPNSVLILYTFIGLERRAAMPVIRLAPFRAADEELGQTAAVCERKTVTAQDRV